MFPGVGLISISNKKNRRWKLINRCHSTVKFEFDKNFCKKMHHRCNESKKTTNVDAGRLSTDCSSYSIDPKWHIFSHWQSPSRSTRRRIVRVSLAASIDMSKSDLSSKERSKSCSDVCGTSRLSSSQLKFLDNNTARWIDVSAAFFEQAYLKHLNKWNFDIFRLNIISGCHPVISVGMQINRIFNLSATLRTNNTNFYRCLSAIERGYHSCNPYHNAVHAADVAQALFCFFQDSYFHLIFKPLDVACCFMAAFGHDLYHPGVNQKHLENTGHFLCSLYKDSVLENFHWRCTMSILIECDVLGRLTVEELNSFKNLLCNLIVATDMQRQQEYLTRFKNSIRGRKMGRRTTLDRMSLMQLMLKCADISNPCRPWFLSKRWSWNACEEFYDQGDFEKRLSLPVMPSLDRCRTPMAQVQGGFIDSVARPLFRQWHRAADNQLSKLMLGHLDNNRSIWAYRQRQRTWSPIESHHCASSKPESDVDVETAAAAAATSLSKHRSSSRFDAQCCVTSPLQFLTTTTTTTTTATALNQRRRVTLPDVHIPSSTTWSAVMKQTNLDRNVAHIRDTFGPWRACSLAEPQSQFHFQAHAPHNEQHSDIRSWSSSSTTTTTVRINLVPNVLHEEEQCPLADDDHDDGDNNRLAHASQPPLRWKGHNTRRSSEPGVCINGVDVSTGAGGGVLPCSALFQATVRRGSLPTTEKELLSVFIMSNNHCQAAGV